MKRPLAIAVISILGSLLLALPASASPILVTYEGPGGATIGLPLAGGGTLDVYSFPYYLDGVPAMCDDAQTDVNPGLTWWANLNYLPGNITQMKFYSEFPNATAALLAYEEAAVIFYEGAAGSGVVADGGAGTTGAEGNVAVWYLFSNPTLYTGQYAVASDPEIQGIIQAAAAIVASGTFNYSQVVFFTPDPSLTLNPPAGGLAGGLNASQEFIALASVEQSTIPEPATYAMFGAGLLALGWLSGRLRRASIGRE